MPAIPDNFFKIFIVLGLFLFGWSFLEDKKITDQYASLVNNLNSSVDSFNISLSIVKHQQKKVFEQANIIATRYGIKNPITNSGDTLYTLAGHIPEGTINKSFLDSTYHTLFDKIEDANFDMSVQKKFIDVKKERLKDDKREYEAGDGTTKMFMLLGAFLVVMGSIGLSRDQAFNGKILQAQYKQKGLFYDYCQSCGKIFSSMREHGTRQNGEINYAFCNKCYMDGAFTESDLTFNEMLDRSDSEPKHEGKPKKDWLRKRLSSLERWRKIEY